ncbi:translation initiation factor IF-2 [Phyllobacterium sp. BT25]|uniref:Translation initiation factor IF-2 n=1 Tax=Phyllobacterium pellucidum TaxID=2740464 RepID=A0A849VP75_9HYPH|nr:MULTISPECIES: translation initiation factor IF-2 [Phyllobacterium]NTS30834.1 translation initiation factor IF-2 [Phyllobacterium pellucidum]SFI63388.1 bacterial translation initiation factor 2 (bIF-2) [Phyllobacterium sp. CL33Tsu]
MSDTKSTDDKTLGVNKKTLTLKRPGVEQSTVRQNFSHGRTKSVVVETKKRKFNLPDHKPEVAPPAAAAPAPAPSPAPAQVRPAVQPAAAPVSAPAAAPRPAATATAAPVAQPTARPAQPQQRPSGQQQPYRPAGQRPNDRSGMVLNTLSSAELEARRKALEGSKARDAEDRAKAALEATRRAEEDALRAKEREESARRQAEEEERLRREAEAKQKAEEESRKRQPELKTADDSALKAPARKTNATEEEDDRRGPAGARRGTSAVPAKPEVRAPKVVRGEDERRRGKLTLGAALDDEGGRNRSLSAMRRRQEKFKRGMQQETREKIAREVILPETITIQELAQRMAERSVDVIKFLMKEGQMMKPGDLIDADTAQLIAEEFGHTVRRVAESDVEEGIFNVEDDAAALEPRPPVVTIMGHVDHGKTSLLDAIRHANVVSGEAGGITQHIGAYQVEQNGQKITFIDTPGHAAFTAMRARGAQATDIAILVVAADDSVMPQTIESINHAKAAGVPIIVAINKIDKPSADPQKVRNGLLQHEVFVESMGGETLDVEVSAKTGAGLEKLLEAILLQAEILDLRADPHRTAEGVVIEAKLERGRGSVATVLVQKGTLHPGDIIVAGSEWGRVRALVNDRGENMKEAGPATPVEVLGLQGPPQAGDRFAVVENEAKAREISEYRTRLAREKAVAKQAGSRGSLEQMMSQLQVSGQKEFPLLIKGDVQGSIEAISGALDKLGTDEVRARIIHSGAGGITESDIALAEASNAAIIGFNVRANKQARDLAEREGIEIRYYNIIYDLVDDVKAAMSGLLSPERRETFLGNAEILEVFNITKVGKVAGCRVTEGKVERGAGVRLIRDNVVIHEGKLKTLKRFKDEVSEVPAGQECGMAFENYDDIRAGDTIEAFRVEHVTRTL